MGGIQDETGVVNTTMALKDININLQSWRKSLMIQNHTVIDLIEEGLYPMSDFVLERNFQRRLMILLRKFFFLLQDFILRLLRLQEY